MNDRTDADPSGLDLQSGEAQLISGGDKARSTYETIEFREKIPVLELGPGDLADSSCEVVGVQDLGG